MIPSLPLGKNIKLLRVRNKLNQQHLASSLGITRAALASYETGKSIPPVPVLMNIAQQLGYSMDTLSRLDLACLSELELRQLEAGNDIFVSGSRIRVLATSVDPQQRENITLVPLKARSGYTMGYQDPEFIRQLPVFQLPFLQNDRSYRAFQTEGDSMTPIPSGAYVIGEYLENWLAVKDGTPCVVITHEDGIVFKIVYPHQRRNRFLLKSLNPLYQPFELDVRQIREMWKFVYYFSHQMPETLTDSETMMARLIRIEEKLTKVNEPDPAQKS